MHAQIPGRGVPGGPADDTSGCPTGPIERAIEVIGDRWTLLIVHQALVCGTTRFGDFNRTLRIPTKVLTLRLQALVQAGVFERVVAPQGRSPHEYRLTVKGRHLWPVMGALLGWGVEWLPAEE